MQSAAARSRHLHCCCCCCCCCCRRRMLLWSQLLPLLMPGLWGGGGCNRLPPGAGTCTAAAAAGAGCCCGCSCCPCSCSALSSHWRCHSSQLPSSAAHSTCSSQCLLPPLLKEISSAVSLFGLGNDCVAGTAPKAAVPERVAAGFICHAQNPVGHRGVVAEAPSDKHSCDITWRQAHSSCTKPCRPGCS